MDYSFGEFSKAMKKIAIFGLNPCSNGLLFWRSKKTMKKLNQKISLNPCSNGLLFWSAMQASEKHAIVSKSLF